MIETLPGILLGFGYWLLFAVIALDCAGLPVAGELLLIALGALVRSGRADAVSVVVIAASAAVAGHALGYFAGRVAGPRLLKRTKAVVPSSAVLLFSRFLIGARVLISPMTGWARVPFARFLAFDAVGAVVWVSAFLLIGYAGGPWAAFAGAVVGSHLPVVVAAIGVALLVKAVAGRRRIRPTRSRRAWLPVLLAPDRPARIEAAPEGV